MLTLEDSKDIIGSLQEALRQEKWTRATIDSYTKKSFESLDDVLEKSQEGHLEGQLLMICQDHLQVSPKSIISLYISGILHLKQDEILDNPLYDLIVLFREHHKTSIVELLANKLLEYGEDRFALLSLQDVYTYN